MGKNSHTRRRDYSTIFSILGGLNNRVSPIRIPYDREEGISQMSATHNIIVDETGAARVRPGYTPLAEGPWHSLFYDGGEIVGVKGQQLCLLTPVDSGADVRVLAVGFNDRASFAQVNDDIYCTCGNVQGIVSEGSFRPWPATMNYGRETDRVFTGPFPARHIAFHLGRIWLATGNVVAFSEPLGFSLFDLANSIIPFDAPVLMMRPVAGGIFISTSKAVYFIPGNEPQEFERKVACATPAREWSVACRLLASERLGLDPGSEMATWVARDGIYVGAPNGTVSNLTEAEVIFPATASGGACGFFEEHLFFTIGV